MDLRWLRASWPYASRSSSMASPRSAGVMRTAAVDERLHLLHHRQPCDGPHARCLHVHRAGLHANATPRMGGDDDCTGSEVRRPGACTAGTSVRWRGFAAAASPPNFYQLLGVKPGASQAGHGRFPLRVRARADLETARERWNASIRRVERATIRRRRVK